MTQNSIADNRMVWLDVVRCVAMLMVIGVHCIDPFYISPTMRVIPEYTHWAAIYGSLLRPSVPLFVMMTGLLLLPVRQQPLGTFYVWASLENLPGKLTDADYFFHECLKKKVITVPGHFFDVRPYRSRPTKEPYSHWVRFSYGPDRRTVATALSRMAEVIREHR